MKLIHLTSSTFFGGPERQMLGLADALPSCVQTRFLSFSESGRCQPFLNEVRARGFEAEPLRNDFPRLGPTLGELTSAIRGCDVLLCHGYKANLLGRIASRRAGVPAVAVSRGWTGESRRVKCYEWLDRRHLRFMDRVVCVSDGQAEKVRRWCRVPERRIRVIRNSARLDAFAAPTPGARERLLAFFPSSAPASKVVLAAGRLSPEKGFGVLVEAAARNLRENPEAGFVLFGEGALREVIEQQIAELGLAGRFILAGFHSDLDSLIPAADLVVLPSFTEGLPNVALEASAAGVPVVATAVGGTPEVVANGVNGLLVPPGQPDALAEAIGRLLGGAALRGTLGEAGRRRMRDLFTFEAQAASYLELFDELMQRHPVAATAVASAPEI